MFKNLKVEDFTLIDDVALSNLSCFVTWYLQVTRAALLRSNQVIF